MKLFYQKQICEQVENAPALIMAHGVFGSFENLGAIARIFSQHFTLYRLDLRNHGKSPHADSMTFSEMAEDVKKVMDDEGLENAAVLGHSLGGKVMMELATTYPERVSHVIAGDIAPVTYPSHQDPVLAALQSVDLTIIKSRSDADEQLKKTIEEQGTRQFLLKNLVRDSDGQFQWRLNLEAIVKNYPLLRNSVADDREYNGPTLFIRGELSRYVQERNYPDIYARFPNAKIETIKGASHWLHAEYPKEFAQLVLDFVK